MERSITVEKLLALLKYPRTASALTTNVLAHGRLDEGDSLTLRLQCAAPNVHASDCECATL